MLPEELKRLYELNVVITNSGKSSAPWSYESYEQWSGWTSEKCQAHETWA